MDDIMAYTYYFSVYKIPSTVHLPLPFSLIPEYSGSKFERTSAPRKRSTAKSTGQLISITRLHHHRFRRRQVSPVQRHAGAHRGQGEYLGGHKANLSNPSALLTSSLPSERTFTIITDLVEPSRHQRSVQETQRRADRVSGRQRYPGAA